MLNRRAVLAGALSSALTGISGSRAADSEGMDKIPSVGVAPLALDADERAYSREVEKASPGTDPRTSGFGSLQLLREGTGESIVLRYRSEGQLDRRAVAELSWFWRDVRDGDQAVWIDEHLLDFVSSVQSTMANIHGGMLPFILTSGFRTARHNAAIETASRNSLHKAGRAGDFKVPGYPPRALAIAGRTFKGGGVGVYSRFTHLDVGALRCWPYSCGQIMGDPNG